MPPGPVINRRRLYGKLDQDSSVIYMLNDELRFTFCNQAWDRFAAANGGAGLDGSAQIGRHLLDSISPPIRPYFEAAYEQVRVTGQSWEHLYECSSAELERTFRMFVSPGPEGEGFIVVNSPVLERPHDPRRTSPPGPIYADAEGHITMCGRCRRSRVASAETASEGVWNWVPAHLLETPKVLRYVLCAACFSIYYPNIASHWSV